MALLTGYENYPVPFQNANQRQTKPLMIVVEIEDVATLYSIGDIYQVVRYGDGGIHYGDANLLYGSLKLKSGVSSYITLQGSLQIAQKLEPEQAKASISTFELVMLDKNGELTKLISPGIVVDEILGGKEVKIRLGYSDTSYPESYFIVFRGSITSTRVQGPTITLSLSDPASKKKTAIFNTTQSSLSSTISDVDTSIPINNTGGFFERVLGPLGTYDPIVATYIRIDDEFMKYTSIASPTSLNVTRPTADAPFGYLQTANITHASGSDVNSYLSLGPENNLKLALKIMLSGWNGNWIDNVPCHAIGTDLGLSTNTNAIVLPNFVDAKLDYGLVVGDFVTISNSIVGNSGQFVITAIVNDISGQTNRVIYIDQPQNEEIDSGALLAFQSKYDTLPILAGLMMTPREVDVDMFEYLQTIYFSTSTYDLAFGIGEKEDNAKDWIDAQIMLATKCFSLTRFGRVSVGYVRPPSTISTKLPLINQDNVVDPNSIAVTRALTNRRFYNFIKYNFDYDGTNSIFRNTVEQANADSITLTRKVSNLTIESKGARTSYSTSLLPQRVTSALLQRFGNAAFELTLSVNFGTGILIEVGDIVLVQDNGNLKIVNFFTGLRNIGEQLFEVIDRTINIVTGNVRLTLLSGIVDSRKDRYAGISPSSTIQAGSSTTVLQLKDFNESNKWLPHVGSTIYLHSPTFSGYDQTCTLAAINAGNLSQLIITGLSIAPPVGTILDIPKYPTSTDPTIDATYKSLYAHITPTLTVVTGIGVTSFTVSSVEAALLLPGAPIIIHSNDYAILSNETTVLSVAGTTITTNTTLGLTPSAGQKIELVGFPDSLGPYRLS
jgi:hypothetical protein